MRRYENSFFNDKLKKMKKETRSFAYLNKMKKHYKYAVKIRSKAYLLFMHNTMLDA